MQDTSGTERNEAGDLRFDTETTTKICISPEKKHNEILMNVD